MSPKIRNGILAFVVLAVAIVIVIPRLNSQKSDFEPNDTDLSKGGTTEFQVTPNPLDAYQTALASEKPIVVEFYAEW